MRVFKTGIEFCSRYDNDDHSVWLCKLTGLDMIEISFCFEFGYFSTYYDGNHHRLNLGLISIYWLN